MSKKLLLFTLVAAILIATPQFAMAHGDEDHGHEAIESAHTETDNAQEALIVLQQSILSLDTLVTAENYGDIHKASEDVGHAAHELAKKTDIPADKKLRLEGAVKQLDVQLDKLHDAADVKNKEGVTAGMKKVKSALSLIEAQVK